MVNEKDISDYFKKKNTRLSVKELVKHFGLEHSDVPALLDLLASLETKGKIMFDGNHCYLPVGSEFYLKHGTVQLSNRGNHYVNLGRGSRINITDSKKNSLAKGDVVFLEQQQPSKNKVHKGYHEGTVARKVEQVNDDVFGSSLVKATLKRCSGSGRLFVMIDDKICYITDTASLAAYPGDIVTVRLENKKHGTVAIKEIVQRKNDKHVFECREKNGEKYWAPVGVNDFPILHKPDDTVQVGDRIVAELKDYTKEGYHIESIKMISKENSFPLNITTMILEHQFPLEFSSSVLEEAEKMTNTISEEEKENRIDLRSLETFTIDPIYAKDLDDAISLEMIDGKYRLYVHIADVSHYVKPDSIIFEEALSRGVSIYPSNFVVPMLPTQLSNHLCSLNPNEDKLTKTCMMEFDSDGNMINYSVFNSIIKSNIKMSYYQVNNILEGRDFDPSYLAYCDTLIKMNELSLLLQKKRASQGFIRYESDEQLFDIDDSHNPISFEDRSLGPAEILIESFMVAANETIANHAYWLETPYFIYRNHEAPTAQKLRCLNTGLKQYTNHTFDIKRINNPRHLQKIFLKLTEGKSKEERKYISNIFLKSMTRAYYSKDSLKHFGLAIDHYATFTSPIRKCSDLINHMFLEELITDTKNEQLDSVKKDLENICCHLSDRQYESTLLEREVNRSLLIKLSDQYIDKVLNAMVTFLSEEGAYVKTDNKIPGLIALNKKYHYNKNQNIWYDRKDNPVYQEGDQLQVKLSSNNEHNGVIMFTDVTKLTNEKKLIKRKE